MNRLLAACIFAGAVCCSAANSQAGDKKSGSPNPGGGGGVILGRCCFLGIVPEPILCEVTTEEKCYYNTAPISWTPGMTCETPCSSAGDVFAGCGTLGPGPQGCMMFNADSGQSFVLQNAGNAFGVHVWVRGTIEPQSNLCSPLTLPGLLNNTIAPCFEGCGTLVSGVECVLFQADNGGLYLLNNLGGFQVGSHVFVRGELAPNCTTYCQQGNGCIHDNTIEPCGGGVTGACCGDLLLNPLGCIVTTQANCDEIGGSYIGDNTSCTNPTNPCNSQLGRCCFLGIVANPPLCEVTTFANCINRPAFVSWTAGLNCDQLCTNVESGACCVPMNIPGVANCIQATLEECEAVGGDYHGDGTNCSALGECPPLGRCCFVGIIFPPYLCDVTTEEECSFYSGSVWTQGLTCDVPCEDMPTGACCLLTAIPEGICIEATVEECAAEGGTYQGDGVPCPSNGTCMFEQGACCIDVDDGPLQYDTCILTSPAQCALQGGVYQGPFSHCILAGCCLPNGACQDADPRCCAASGGTPRNTLCNSVVCTTGPTGACCLVTDIPEGHCIVTTAAHCQELNGEYRGDGTTCNPNGAPCFPPLNGACCIPSPNSTFPMCQILTQQECALAGGAYLGNGTSCPPPGAVCIGPSGACCMDIDDGPLQYDTCNVMTAAQCQQNGGVFQGANTQCMVVACCLPDGTCQDADPRCCVASGGTPRNAPCALALCSNLPTGACCLVANVPGTANCVRVTQQRCEFLGGQYQGDGTHCSAAGLCPPLGRCCFVGIVAHPVLCDVTTQAECQAYAGFVSWTANLTCDAPCEPTGGDDFSGCGTLGPGPQGCILFHADTGETFALEHAGPVLGNRVWVRGTIEPHSFLCFPIIFPALLNNTIGICFDDCGVLVNGAECVLFQSDNGGLYVVQNLGGFAVGDRVRVQGCLNPVCVTICQQGNGCIVDNSIEACNIDPPTGACCYAALGMPGNCFVTSAAICAQVNGQYQGDGTICSSNLMCPNPLGRCCFLGFNPEIPICDMLTEMQCMNLPAPLSWNANLTCEIPCQIQPPTGACCNTPVANPLDCIVVSEEHCNELSGNYAGDGSTCWPVNPCGGQLGQCCFLGFNPQIPICDVTTLAQCYSYPAPISWTPGITCDVPCNPPCEAGDANGDGTVDGRDIEGFVRSLLGSPAAGDHPDCCNFSAPTMSDQVQSFVAKLQS